MNIRNVKEKFRKFETLSIEQLAQVTGEQIDDLRFVVQEFEQRGKVITIDMAKYCGSGCSCSSGCATQSQLYQWVE